ncbi:class I SAM-dependent methyltransferase [Candidatus Woesearchaeota archaeon]|nr:class I SAM-dependent methyltransferase [Candidatus Woesearchaeota archaeon]
MSQRIAPENVTKLYEVTGITPLAGIEDYTEGIYHGNQNLDHTTAKRNQHEYLLDEILAIEGFRLLEIGCGLGTLLQAARERGVVGTGITISQDQVKKCRAKGLDVHLLNYRSLPSDWFEKFDGIIANGSLEHFCQPEDALEGRQDGVYREMFDIFHRLLDPKSLSRRVATTAIHFSGEHIDPKKFLRNPLLQIFDEIGFHASILHVGYGGYYPIRGQLSNCANGKFDLVKEVDGTEDYRLTSEHWCQSYKKALFTNPRFMYELFKHFIMKPIHTTLVTASYVGPESWAWQFRGDNPPTRLYRHTWQRVTC